MCLRNVPPRVHVCVQQVYCAVNLASVLSDLGVRRMEVVCAVLRRCDITAKTANGFPLGNLTLRHTVRWFNVSFPLNYCSVMSIMSVVFQRKSTLSLLVMKWTKIAAAECRDPNTRIGATFSTVH